MIIKHKLPPVDPKAPLTHHRPKSRRDFLAQGFMTGGAFAFTGSFLTSLEAKAACASEGNTGAANAAPAGLLTFDYAGGANFLGRQITNYDAGGQLLPVEGYARFGLTPDQTPDKPGMMDTTLVQGMGLFGMGQMRQAFLAEGLDQLTGNLSGFIMAARSDNDTSSNPLNASAAVAALATPGDLGSLLGSSSKRASGGKSQSVLQEHPVAVEVRSAEDLVGMVTPGLITENFQDRATTILKTVENMAPSMRARFASMNYSAATQELIRCGYLDANALLSQDPEVFNLANDPNYMAIFGDDRNGPIAAAVVNGWVPAGTVQFGGFDYHNKRALSNNEKHLEVETLMAKVIRYAEAVGRPLAINIISDGAVAAGTDMEGDFLVWQSENANRGCNAMLFYHPTMSQEITKKQLGATTADGGGRVVENASIISNNPKASACAALQNYIRFAGYEAKGVKVEQVVTDSPVKQDDEATMAVGALA